MSHIGRSAISPGLVVESCAITQGVDFGRLLQQLPPATMIGLAATGKREDRIETLSTLIKLWNDKIA